MEYSGVALCFVLNFQQLAAPPPVWVLSGIAQFTYELEHEHVLKLSFVDVLVIRQSNNKFETTVYYKKTNINIYLNWLSQLLNTWKRGTDQQKCSYCHSYTADLESKIIYTGTKLTAKFQMKYKTKVAHKHDLAYYAKCPECDESYVGKTGRRL